MAPTHEQRPEELRRVQPRLAHHAPHRLAAPQPPRSHQRRHHRHIPRQRGHQRMPSPGAHGAASADAASADAAAFTSA
ncbi:MAG: hypothetical protein ACK56I_13465, partial [bacterium]